MSTQALLENMFAAAVDAADPMKCLAHYLPEKPKGRILVIGAGKATARMAQAVEAAWGPCEGLIIVPKNASLPLQGIQTIEGNHPVPNQAGMDAAYEILKLAQSAQKDDFVLCLISGGGSSLLSLPCEGLTLDDKILLNSALLKSGAPIDEMNVVRKRFSAIKGGRLAEAAHPAQVLTLLISDVPGDDPAFIASGPTIGDPTNAADALEIIQRYHMDLPQKFFDILNMPLAETPAPDAAFFKDQSVIMTAKPQKSLEAAANIAEANGYTPMILGDAIEGESKDVGTVMAAIAKQVQNYGQPARGKVALISGGETTVTVKDRAGKGGRCTEFLLGLVLAGWGELNYAALACDTDGRDGSEQNAGALWLPTHQAKAERSDANSFLAAHDAYSFFEKHDALVHTGPTHTNVNDLRVILVETHSAKA